MGILEFSPLLVRKEEAARILMLQELLTEKLFDIFGKQGFS